MSAVLEVKSLSKTYRQGQAVTFQVKDISFKVEAGQVMGFIGRNGAGKTTTLKAILNLIRPEAGQVLIFGKDFLEAEDEIKQETGYAVGGMSYYKRKRIKDIAEVTKTFYDNWDDQAYRHYLKGFKLDENKRLMDLSEGMKVKFYLTMALSHQAKLLILDEPSSGLDPVSRDEMAEIFKKLAAKGVAILFSTHITSDLDKCADAITYIKDGKIVASMDKQDFIEHFANEMATTSPSLEDIMVYIEHEEVDI
ncbi:MAG: ABC transporter ATP-binding protein [Lachnospiraceae bacterium]|nr:ABC transporter ATP-binding protein [Candidatus Equihabitans merdae]